MKKRNILIVINQFFKGGAETALINFFHVLNKENYHVDLLIFDQIDLKGTVSLIPQIPEWVHVVNVAQNEKQAAFLKKALFKVTCRLTGKQPFRRKAKEYLEKQFYDVAISYGEWFSSALVAQYAAARRKYVWIHADIDKAAFLHPDILRYQDSFDGFIFASEHSMDAAVRKYPQLKDRSCVVHNTVNISQLLERSQEPLPVELPQDGLPVLLTVANIREEKNHLRQVEAMKMLFERGTRFHWFNIGSLANAGLVTQVRQAVEKAGLEDYFHLVGALENPYGVMRRADAVCVLSDHESWSMVITEAKELGVPVIATRTSGALEQIRDRENGLLCGFSAQEIADCIEEYLKTEDLGSQIRENLKSHTAHSGSTVKTLECILSDMRPKVLYVFDNINYMSGARNAALMQAEVVGKIAQVDLFSAEACCDKSLIRQYRIISMGQSDMMRLLSTPIRDALRCKTVSCSKKLMRFAYAVLARLGQESLIPNFILAREMRTIFEGYDVIFVVSEASKLRKFVSSLKNPGKVQWIHTDYAAWKERSAWTRAITKNDNQIYKKYDTVVCLNQTLRDKFVSIYPQFAEKTIAVPNPVPRDEILRKSSESTPFLVDRSKHNLITIGRFEPEKRYDRLLEIAAELKDRGFCFHWYFVGDGMLFDEIKEKRDQLGLEQEVVLTGALQNPYPLLKQCDLMVLLSEYEGTPVTIDEANVLGVPVLANDVGGVKEQIGKGNGCVIEKSIVEPSAVAENIFEMCNR